MDKTKLYSILRNYSMPELDVALNLFIWLTYNGFTIEDLRTNMSYLRYKKDLIERFAYPRLAGGWPVARKEIVHLDKSLSKSDVLGIIGYPALRSLKKILKVIRKANIADSDIDSFVRESRKVVLEHDTYGRVRE